MEDIERIKDRLDNIASVGPIVNSLRVIAAGTWRAALRHLQSADAYIAHLSEVLAVVLPGLPPGGQEATARRHGPSGALATLLSPETPSPNRALMLVIASERGMAGAFNDTVLNGAERLIAQQQLQSDEVLVAALGHRAEVHLSAAGYPLYGAYPLPVTRVPTYQMIRGLADELRQGLLDEAYDSVYLVYSPYQAGATLAPVSRRWLPIDRALLPAPLEVGLAPIVEGDPLLLAESAVIEWVYARFYQLVITSVTSEQSARYRAMDAASSNLSRIIEELTQSYHTARQHAITMEMLDLVAGSGMLRRPEERARD